MPESKRSVRPGDEQPPSAAPAPPRHEARLATLQEMKAFAHPLRMELYRLLGALGQATASTLARETGESTGQTSYHLRQLERFGFVEEVPDRGTARERWWRAVGFSFTDSTDPQLVGTVNRWLIEDELAVLRESAERLPNEPAAWQDASTRTTTTAWMTVQELGALTDELLATLDRHVTESQARRGSSDVTRGPARDDERRVRVYLTSLPLPLPRD